MKRTSFLFNGIIDKCIDQEWAAHLTDVAPVRDPLVVQAVLRSLRFSRAVI